MTTAKIRRRWPLWFALALSAATSGCMDLPPGGTRWTPSGGAWPGNSPAASNAMDDTVRCRQSLGTPLCWRVPPPVSQAPMTQMQPGGLSAATAGQGHPMTITPGQLPATVSQ